MSIPKSFYPALIRISKRLQASQSSFAAISAVGLCVLLTLPGCAPPPKNTHAAPTYGTAIPADGGKPVVTVDPNKKLPPFKTILIDGAELIESRDPVGRFGGDFRENQIGDGPKTFNAYASFDATSTNLSGMLLSGLVTTDAYTGEVAPYLAKEVKIGDDKLTYTVTLRKGLQWSDGKPITAHDVVFTWNRIIRPGLGNPSTRDTVTVEDKFPSVRQINNLTVEFKTAKPFAPFLRNLGNPILPSHVFEPLMANKGNEVFATLWSTQDAQNHPEKFISNGMWLLESYVPRERAVFRRNPKFFFVDKQGRRLPYLDRYIVSFVRDPNNDLLRFEQGKVDSLGVQGNQVAYVRKLSRPAFKLYNLGPATGTTFITFNLNNRKKDGKPIVSPVKSAWFRDVNFRQAVNHAINREDIVNNVLRGVGAPLFTSESPKAIFFNKKLAGGFPIDPDYSRELLRKSGYTWDAKNHLHDSNGNLVRFTLLTNAGNTEREAVGVNIKQDLEALGMTVDFKPIDFNVLIGKLGPEGTWDAILLGLTGGDPLEPNSGANVWKSDGGIHMFNQRPFIPGKPVDLSDRFPWEARVDDIFNRGAQVFDTEQRRSIYNEYQQIIYDQAPFIYLYSPLSIIAVRDRIRNFAPSRFATFHNLESIWIDDAAEK